MSQVPIVRLASRLNVVINLLCLAAFSSVGFAVGGPGGTLIGGGIFLLLASGLKAIFARAHRQAIACVKRGEFVEAIEHYEKSLAYFQRYPWIDRWRALVLLSGSSMSYRQMALIGIAFSHSQLGNGALARQCYEQTLREFPDCIMSKAALRMLDSVK